MGKRLGFGVPPSAQGFVPIVTAGCLDSVDPRESNEFFDTLSCVSPRHVVPLSSRSSVGRFLDWEQPVAASLLIHLPRPLLQVLWDYGLVV